jgi:hypothetical protein
LTKLSFVRSVYSLPVFSGELKDERHDGGELRYEESFEEPRMLERVELIQ